MPSEIPEFRDGHVRPFRAGLSDAEITALVCWGWLLPDPDNPGTYRISADGRRVQFNYRENKIYASFN